MCAAIDADDLLHDAGDRSDVVRDDDDGHAPIEFLQCAVQFLFETVVHEVRRFVQNQQFRIGDYGPAQQRPLHLSSRHFGGAGALARYGVSELANTLVGRQYPLGTFVVNVLGCFLFGLIWELAAVRLLISDTVRLIILVGFMGSFTTFSSLIFDSFALGQTRLALLLFNIGAQTILGFAALFLGMTVGKHW